MEVNRNVYIDTINWLLSCVIIRAISLIQYIDQLINYRKLYRIEKGKERKREIRREKKIREEMESQVLLIEQLIVKRNNGENLSESEKEELYSYDEFEAALKQYNQDREKKEDQEWQEWIESQL